MSRQYRNTAQWLELIEAFERSGQTQVEFCAALKLNPKYFSKRRSELLSAHPESAFVQVQAQSISTPAADSGASLALRFQQTELTLPLSVDLRWLAGLIKALSPFGLTHLGALSYVFNTRFILC